MTVEHVRMSYRERLANLGSLIDSEISELVSREIERAKSDLAVHSTQATSAANEESREATASEIEECLLLLQSRSDTSPITEYLDSKPYLCADESVFMSAGRELRDWMLARVSDEDLKRLFQVCCSRGRTDILKCISDSWMRRLLNGSGPEPNIILLIRAHSISGTRDLLARGVDVSLSSTSGDNVVQEAVSTGLSELVELVLNHIPQESLLSILTHKNRAGNSCLESLNAQPEQMRAVLLSHYLVGLSVEGNALYKEGQFQQAAERYRDAISVCESVPSDQKTENLVKLEYNIARSVFRLQRFSESITHCTRCIELDPTYLNALSQRAQAHASLSNFDAAKKDYESIIAQLSSSADAGSPGAVRQQNEFRLKLLEIDSALKTDHYTVLGVERFSDEQQIKAAYRQLAKKHHPDKVVGDSEDAKLRAKHVFTRIQEAYETLTGSKDEYDMNLRIQLSTEAVRQNLLRRRYSVESPPARQARMGQFLGSSLEEKTFRASPPSLSRSFDVLFRN